MKSVAADLSADEQIASNPKSPKKAHPLPNIQTKFFFGTEDGELVYADLKVDMDSESGKFNGKLKSSFKFYHDKFDFINLFIKIILF